MPTTPRSFTDAGDTQLIIVALLGIATVVILISFLKFHPFLSWSLMETVISVVGLICVLIVSVIV
ncbi:hypothetical protein [Calidifontibacter indicus]|uniref:hypothetical protein n=1 Tax=Calidifontibacter indicus TaxID=419650 RepID=UPI003D715B90